MKYKELKAEKSKILAEIKSFDNAIKEVSNFQRINPELALIKLRNIEFKLNSIVFKFKLTAVVIFSTVAGVIGAISK